MSPSVPPLAFDRGDFARATFAVEAARARVGRATTKLDLTLAQLDLDNAVYHLTQLTRQS